MKSADILQDAKEIFALCEERDDENRTAALDDLRFSRLGEQWHPEDEIQRRKDGRPCLTINRMPAFIRQVVNDARQNSPAITVRAADSKADPETAQVMSDLIRDIEAQSDADTAYDTAVDFAVTCGFAISASTPNMPMTMPSSRISASGASPIRSAFMAIRTAMPPTAPTGTSPSSSTR